MSSTLTLNNSRNPHPVKMETVANLGVSVRSEIGVLPSTGLVLVFGGPGSGKDCAVLQPLINAFAEQGRGMSVIDHVNGRLDIPKQKAEENAHARLLVVNEAQLLFGHDAAPPKGYLAEVQNVILQEISRDTKSLIVLSFQSVGTIGPRYRETLCWYKSGDVILKSYDREMDRYVYGRTIKRFGGLITKPAPSPLSLITDSNAAQPFAQSLISRRTNNDGVKSAWETRAVTLPMIFSIRNLNGGSAPQLQ